MKCVLGLKSGRSVGGGIVTAQSPFEDIQKMCCDFRRSHPLTWPGYEAGPRASQQPCSPRAFHGLQQHETMAYLCLRLGLAAQCHMFRRSIALHTTRHVPHHRPHSTPIPCIKGVSKAHPISHSGGPRSSCGSKGSVRTRSEWKTAAWIHCKARSKGASTNGSPCR